MDKKNREKAIRTDREILSKINRIKDPICVITNSLYLIDEKGKEEGTDVTRYLNIMKREIERTRKILDEIIN